MWRNFVETVRKVVGMVLEFLVSLFHLISPPYTKINLKKNEKTLSEMAKQTLPREHR